MLLIGRSSSSALSRRGVLQVGASTVLGLSMNHWLASQTQASVPGSAKAVILLWLWGGPSQLDTFDPKPNAPVEFRGPFSTIPTKIPGVRFCELFPKLASVSDRLAVIRSLNTASNDHGVAGTIGLTGSSAGGKGLDGKPLPGSPRPALGSVVARVLTTTGLRKQTTEQLPPFLVVGGKLHQGKKPIIGEGGGPLGAMYDPFRLEYDPIVGTKIPALQLNPELTPERLDDRVSLIKSLDALERANQQANRAGKYDQYRTQAFGMLTSPKARQMFDLGQERDPLRDEYGRTRFGQSCILARRLVEHGVPFVQVNWSDHVEAEEDSGDGGWDHHYRNFQIMQDRHAMWLDRAVTTLLTDLEQRGLLKSTLVLAVGEFGRTPKINDKAGREHHPNCYSALAFGGGVVGGRVIGESDAKADRPKESPFTPADLCATVQHAIGITSDISNSLGVSPGGQVIEGLF